MSGPTIGPAFAAACPTRMAENSVVEIMTLRGLAMATKNISVRGLAMSVQVIDGGHIPRPALAKRKEYIMGFIL